jgi:hypothetical protein
MSAGDREHTYPKGAFTNLNALRPDATAEEKAQGPQPIETPRAVLEFRDWLEGAEFRGLVQRAYKANWTLDHNGMKALTDSIKEKAGIMLNKGSAQ